MSEQEGMHGSEAEQESNYVDMSGQVILTFIAQKPLNVVSSMTITTAFFLYFTNFILRIHGGGPSGEVEPSTSSGRGASMVAKGRCGTLPKGVDFSHYLIYTFCYFHLFMDIVKSDESG